ncbi:arginyl-tRNA--protein transferase 1 isoform X8 [Heptranchias perlo]|uniref:arginyl-tRNA--protein transferase 1 isoform X8 n=1 Tax=Heptranchias perlo TaxID=212740 RepID=UPI003559E763
MAARGGGAVSIVEYFTEDEGGKCGYCKGTSSNYSNGMWAHGMTVQDYQDLIDRGWRRSGMYVYKPTMNRTCCPQYTIRCHVLDFKLAKSSKKVLKKMTRFLSKGEVAKGGGVEPMDSHSEDTGFGHLPVACTSEVNIDIEKPLKIVSLEEEIPESSKIQEKPQPDGAGEKGVPGQKHPFAEANDITESFKSIPKPGRGADPNKPPCRKAKDVRRERKLEKLLQKQQQIEVVDVSLHQEPSCANPCTLPLQHQATQANQPKLLEELISESLSPDAVHQLEVRLVRSSPPNSQFKATFQESYQVYKRYQMAIHKDPPDKATEQQGQYHPSDLLCPETYVWVPIEKCRTKLDQSKYNRLNEDPNAEDEQSFRDLGKVLVLYRSTAMPYSIYQRRQKRANDEAAVRQYASLVGQTCAERILLYRS